MSIESTLMSWPPLVAAKDKSRAEQKEFMKATEDLRREIRSEMRALKEWVEFTIDLRGEMKKIDRDGKE